jgi:hypothetical protein
MRYEDAREIITEALELIDDVLNEAYEAKRKRLDRAWQKAYAKGAAGDEKRKNIEAANRRNSEKMERRLKKIGKRQPYAYKDLKGNSYIRGKAISWAEKKLRGKLLDRDGNLPRHLRPSVV